jgi:hypothetical protein
MTGHLIQQGVLRICCADLTKRGPVVDLGHGLTYTRCECGRRHFEGEAEPTHYGIALKSAG